MGLCFQSTVVLSLNVIRGAVAEIRLEDTYCSLEVGQYSIHAQRHAYSKRDYSHFHPSLYLDLHFRVHLEQGGHGEGASIPGPDPSLSLPRARPP